MCRSGTLHGRLPIDLEVCRYRGFLRKTQTMAYDFQIANHNLVLADILSQKGGRNRLLPQSSILIFDETHKLLDVARQMYGMTFDAAELEQHRLLTASKASPFDFENHALLYLPGDMPFPDMKNGAYMEKLLKRLMKLIRQAEPHGHMLVLFTSYRMVKIVYQELSKPRRAAGNNLCV